VTEKEKAVKSAKYESHARKMYDLAKSKLEQLEELWNSAGEKSKAAEEKKILLEEAREKYYTTKHKIEKAVDFEEAEVLMAQLKLEKEEVQKLKNETAEPFREIAEAVSLAQTTYDAGKVALKAAIKAIDAVKAIKEGKRLSSAQVDITKSTMAIPSIIELKDNACKPLPKLDGENKY